MNKLLNPGIYQVNWLALATLPHHGLFCHKGRPFLSVTWATRAVSWHGAGVRMGAAVFAGSWTASLLIFAVIWAVIFPALMVVHPGVSQKALLPNRNRC